MVAIRRPTDALSPAYSVTARALHWITAVLVLTQIPLGLLVVNVKLGAWGVFLYDLHKSIGPVLIPIVLFRLAYRLTWRSGRAWHPSWSGCSGARRTNRAVHRSRNRSGAGEAFRPENPKCGILEDARGCWGVQAGRVRNGVCALAPQRKAA